ncbi:hypothetical protein CF15_03875 [Pyrodictium occultum]|uniref:GINS subunit domain-containing protein n=1 Tax=Pyrodictium occultum TaxID=2309 RepID=A0A0V8RV83_PYROC|nr:DNA replication complex GINS family protein [Pyrodictium occultum]KSW11939.1 hypothetical protein CF15_03875 [Pyrodictium occultum]
MGKDRLSLMLKISEIAYKLRPVRVMVLRDEKPFTVDGQKVELQKGIEMEVPYWLSRVLIEEEVANTTEMPITIEDIARVHFSALSARTPADLEPLPQNFYRNVKDLIESLEERIRRELNPALLEEKQKAIQYLAEIVDKRLLIMLQSLRSPTAIAEVSSKLAPEEAMLLETLYKTIEEWKRNILPEHQ